jgi:hypothetical protein
VLEVGVIDVGINTEETLENYLNDVEEVLGERYSEGTGENLLII